MPGTTDTVKAILTPGEFVIRKEAVDMIGAPILERINDMPEKGGHSSIDRLIQMATMSNMKAMYGGGMVNAGPKPMQMGGMTEEYGHGGMVKDKMMMMAKGGQLKPVPEDNPGLAKLPEKVRNRMGYMQDGGEVQDNTATNIMNLLALSDMAERTPQYSMFDAGSRGGVFSEEDILGISEGNFVPAAGVLSGFGLLRGRGALGKAVYDRAVRRERISNLRDLIRNATGKASKGEMRKYRKELGLLLKDKKMEAEKADEFIEGILRPKQDGGMVEDNLMGMMGGGMMKKPMSSYQNGGTVSLPQYVDAVKKVTGALGGSFDEDMYTEEGGFSRLNLANRLGVDPESMTIDTLSYEGPGSFVFDVKGMSPEGKELSAQETMSGGGLPVEMVLNRAIEDHANRGKGDSAEAFRLSDQRNSLLNILQGIKDNVRFQEGGMVGPPPPPMDDPLQIGMRQASPEMYAGQTLGGMSEEEALEQGIMQSQMMKNQAIEDSAMQSLQLLRLRAMMADPSMQESINPISLDSLINTPMQSEGMQGPTINRDMAEMLNMEMMKRGREALMRGMMREGQKDPLEALR
tara:strand:- start:2226 stop:3950 length:1725 start_codon:yes stop_codon:yes gene_type:complete